MSEVFGRGAFAPPRWVKLLAVFLMNTVFNFLIFQLGGLAALMKTDFGISSAQLAIALSVPFLANALFGVLAGAAADRFGAARIVAFGSILTLICAFGRISSTGFWPLVAWMFALGIGPAFLNANVAKILGAWFPAELVGRAMGLYIAGANAGITLAVSTSALFPSIDLAFLVSGIAATLVVVFWLFVAGVSRQSAASPDAPRVGRSLGLAAKSGNLWVGAIAMFFFMGTFVTQNGFLADALAQGKAMDAVGSGLMASMLSISFIAGTLLGPPFAARVGLLRPFLAPAAFLAALASYLAWILAPGPLTMLFLILAGLALGTAVPLVMSLPILLPEIGGSLAGSAGGIISTFQMAGAFFLSSYVIIPLAGADWNRVFLFIGAGYLVFGLATSLLPELGRKAKTRSSG